MRRATFGLADLVRGASAPLAVAIVPAVLVVVLVAGASLALDIPVQDLMADPLARLEAHPLIGFTSNLGILLWAAAAGACLVGALALRAARDPDAAEVRRFFVASAAVTVLLVIDDTFQLHEDLVPRLFGRGHTLVLLGYVALVAVYVWRFRRLLATTQWMILAVAGLAFALSMGIDLVPVALAWLPGGLEVGTESRPYEFIEHVVEDGAKLVGIALWLTYFARTAAAAGRPGDRT